MKVRKGSVKVKLSHLFFYHESFVHRCVRPVFPHNIFTFTQIWFGACPREIQMFLEKAENIRQDNSFLKAFVSRGTSQLKPCDSSRCHQDRKKKKKKKLPVIPINICADKLMNQHIIRLTEPQVSEFFTTMLFVISRSSPHHLFWAKSSSSDGSVWFLAHFPD